MNKSQREKIDELADSLFESLNREFEKEGKTHLQMPSHLFVGACRTYYDAGAEAMANLAEEREAKLAEAVEKILDIAKSEMGLRVASIIDVAECALEDLGLGDDNESN